jgi:CRISPR-associated endonuclease/helicase Cas3
MGESVWAHSANPSGGRHKLVDHLRSTGELARGFADRFGAGELAFWMGLLHDVGKGSCAWQRRLLEVERSGDRVGLDHKSLGASMAMERGCGKFALAIDGHHGGLRSPKMLVDRLDNLSGAERESNADAERAVRRLLPELAAMEDVAIPQRWFGNELVAEMGLRLVFSALCDADFLDTAAHFNGEAKPEVGGGHDFKRLLARFELRRAELIASRPCSPMDEIRAEVYEACVVAARAEPGIFRLPAPTGSGKTIAAGGFALHHAARHKLGRVIVAVPYLTITEQNASVYRSLLDGRDEPVVLEHHSQVDLDAGSRWHRLAAENWDAPFVVTTTVRLFEALFGRKPSAMRRIHRLAGAVIVLDEVQALPHRLLVPILDGLRTLVTEFGATVLLASTSSSTVAVIPDPLASQDRSAHPMHQPVEDRPLQLSCGQHLCTYPPVGVRVPSCGSRFPRLIPAPKLGDDFPIGSVLYTGNATLPFGQTAGYARERPMAATRQRVAHDGLGLADAMFSWAGQVRRVSGCPRETGSIERVCHEHRAESRTSSGSPATGGSAYIQNI